ncbi:MAG: thioredoxin domain-containing protein [Opitutaceae bacterium]
MFSDFHFLQSHLRGLAILIATTSLSVLSAADAPMRPDSRLLNEQSPYLRQHADNLVDWYPWGETAFQKARDEGKPIFLSIGYSTCHWCHVMERESFMDANAADILNTHYVSIKIDREERPDIDRVYMNFVQATTGSGGWPLNVWLTPDLKPFFGGTYFPLEGKYGRPGFKDLLSRIADSWAKDSSEIEASAHGIVQQLQSMSQAGNANASLASADAIEAGVSAFSEQFDAQYGGFSSAPKFPRPSTFNFLHRAATRADSDKGKDILAMTTKTLHAMADGGMYDQIGGGFHRYSVDEFWHVPHFEKMLYDQAQLVVAYLDAYQLTGEKRFADIARDTFNYVSRDMTDPNGGFYSAEDADSLFKAGSPEHGEGVFYVWEKAELDTLLGEKAALFNYVYGVQAEGNAPSDPHEEFTNQNILIKRHSIAEAADKFKLSELAVTNELEAARKRLFEVRKQRPRPHLDDKILTSWNGLMISAYARAYAVLGEPEYLEAASKAATFLQQNLVNSETDTLLRSFREKPSTIDAFAADYTFLIQGLLDLYEAGFDSQWLQWAETLQQKQDTLFWDKTDGSYFASHADDTSVIMRMKESHDGAIPSENSVAARNLLRLSAMLEKPDWSAQAQTILKNFSKPIAQTPTSVPQMLVALDFALQKPQQIVISGKAGASDTQALLNIVNQSFRPHSVVLLADGKKGQAFLSKHSEAYEMMQPIDGKATAYICEDFTCGLPTNDPKIVADLLK